MKPGACIAGLLSATLGAAGLAESAGQQIGINAAAKALALEARSFGLQFPAEDPGAARPLAEDIEARSRVGLGWLDEQLKSGDDSVAAPPAALQEFLEKRRGALWRVVGLLEKESPEWRRKAYAMQGTWPELLPAIALQRILIAAALIEIRGGRSLEAARLLEASWSLSRGLASQDVVIAQLVELGAELLRTATLRKLEDPPAQWMTRLSIDEPWQRMLEAIAAEGRLVDSSNLTGSRDSFRKAIANAWTAVADGLRRVSPCELKGLSDEAIWRPAAQELESHGGPEGGADAELIREAFLPNLTSAVRRAGRVLADREMTLKILELRVERAGSRDGRWPEKMPNPSSSVCPGALYSYRRMKGGIEVSFEGSVDEPSSGLVLPLSFRTGPAPVVTPLPAAAHP